MDAKVGDWVVTPRQGRPVELNALWYNAVCIVADLARRLERPDRADRFESLAANIKAAFNRRFWNEKAGCCYDVIDDGPDGDVPDAAVRPNQLFAVSLRFAALAADRHASVLSVVRGELAVPMGVRTLSPRHPAYQGHYAGNVASRDRAYHNGSAFPWLLGPLVTGMLRSSGRSDAAVAEARQLLEPCLTWLQGDGLGQLCELVDGDAPYTAGGAIAAPIGVGELLRCYIEDILGRRPAAARLAVLPTPSPHVSNPA